MSSTPNRFWPRTIWTGTVLLVLIGVAAVVIRTVVLVTGPRAGRADVDSGFAHHPLLTLIHIVPGLVFFLIAPLQFVRRLRNRAPRVHRWMGRVAVLLGLAIGISALAISFRIAIGGINEIAATVLFDVLFLFCLAKGWMCARRRDFVHHREWMIRMFGIGLGIATTRPIMGVFFATSRLTGLTPHQFFGTAFWLGFTLTVIAAESWINYTRPRLQRTGPAR
ncbi:MAG TPA: DUF2306 domain-containing protein [Bryobacteraceae bacterium]|nr:DUF2306 domain-containing protein [Bryobacteraceae bacterium]